MFSPYITVNAAVSKDTYDGRFEVEIKQTLLNVDKITYYHDGIDGSGACMYLDNGMRLLVTESAKRLETLIEEVWRWRD